VGAAGLQPLLNPQNQNLKDTDFVGTMISNISRNLPFSKNQPLKLADE